MQRNKQKKNRMVSQENSKYEHADCKTIKILTRGVKLKYQKTTVYISGEETSINYYFLLDCYIP